MPRTQLLRCLSVYVFFILLATSTSLFPAIEYDFIDLGIGFSPHKINNQSQIVGTLKYSQPFLPDFEKAASWDPIHGLVVINKEESSSTVAYGINDIGQIVGKAYHSPLFLNVGQPVFWNSKDDAWKAIVYSDKSPTAATSINNASIICGYAVPRYGKNSHAFVWHENTKVTDLHPSNDGMSKAYDINEQGQVIGEISFAIDAQKETTYAFQWTPSDGLQLLNIHSCCSKAYGNNGKGDIVGYFESENGVKNAFLYKADGTLQDLGDLGGSWTVAYSINNQREIVGSGECLGTFHKGKTAFIWKGGKIKSLNNLVDRKTNWWLIKATDINDKGEIVGVSVNDNDESTQHGFLLKPRFKPLFQVDQDKEYKCICFSFSDISHALPEKRFIILPGKAINEINNDGNGWCQPLEMIDLDREGEMKFEHNKLYQVILMFMDGRTSRCFTSWDHLSHKKTELVNAHLGDVVLLPGYFLNDWNNRIHPKTGEVYFWFQPTDVLSHDTTGKMIQYAKKQRI